MVGEEGDPTSDDSEPTESRRGGIFTAFDGGYHQLT